MLSGKKIQVICGLKIRKAIYIKKITGVISNIFTMYQGRYSINLFLVSMKLKKNFGSELMDMVFIFLIEQH